MASKGLADLVGQNSRRLINDKQTSAKQASISGSALVHAFRDLKTLPKSFQTFGSDQQGRRASGARARRERFCCSPRRRSRHGSRNSSARVRAGWGGRRRGPRQNDREQADGRVVPKEASGWDFCGGNGVTICGIPQNNADLSAHKSDPMVRAKTSPPDPPSSEQAQAIFIKRLQRLRNQL
jgi:hypothetical protein